MATRKARPQAARRPRRSAPPDRPAPPVDAPPVAAPSPPIVGLGASAGGLAALEQFFAKAAPGLGLAYVVVQHLDPEHSSVLTELLQRVSRLPVVEVTDRLRVLADTVHVIPPNREMEVLDGVLLLTEPTAPRGHRLTVDGFFQSLAEDQGARAVGVVLSGTGSDGSIGLRAIHDAGGLCLVQAPASAKFDGMPSSALRAVPGSLVDVAEKLPAALAAALDRLDRTARAPPAPAHAAADGLTRVLAVLRAATGRDFSSYKRASVTRRVGRRMAAVGLEDLGAYARHLLDHPAEVKTLFQELLINVTSFFRDPEAFAALKVEVLARLCDGQGAGEGIRVWVAGCATGEEAYTIAILLSEVLEAARSRSRVQVYATDLDEGAIATARAGVYPATISASVSPERLRRYFVPEDAGYRVCKEVRELVVFAVQDLVKDPPFTRLDLVSCRNVFIYMEPELQGHILDLFHYALRPGGVLFLSPTEGIGHHEDLFKAIDRRWRMFRAQRTASPARALLASGLSWGRSPAVSQDTSRAPPSDYAEIMRRLLLHHFAPASVLVDQAGTVLYVHGETGPYLRPAPGQPTLSLAEMAREGLRLDLRAALQRAATKGKVVRRSGLQVGQGAGSLSVDLTVRPAALAKGVPSLLLVSFQETAAAAPVKALRRKGGSRPADARSIQELTRSLAYTRENLQATIEEQQTSHEELQATNEELQSTNEEVQASNEELVTAREELQSVNEELTTVNAELQAKVEQLTGVQDDLKNLFEATGIGTVFLDERLRIKRFTREACHAYRLAPADVGRPLADIKTNLLDHDLIAEAQEVLDTLVPLELEVRCAEGAWYLARLLPYRTGDNVIRGVVLTFSDISKRVGAEAVARAERALAERVVDTVPGPLLVLDGALQVVFGSRSFHETFGTTPQSARGRHVYDLAERRWDLPALRELLERVLPRDQAFERFELPAVGPDGGTRKLYVGGTRIAGPAGSAQYILLTFSP